MKLPGATSTLSSSKAQFKFQGNHGSNFELKLDLVGAPTFFLWVFMGVVLAKDGQGSFASCKCDDVHGYLMFSFCTFSFVLNFYLFFGTHVITQTRDIMR